VAARLVASRVVLCSRELGSELVSYATKTTVYVGSDNIEVRSRVWCQARRTSGLFLFHTEPICSPGNVDLTALHALPELSRTELLSATSCRDSSIDMT
jgi:hypothetical protein